MLAFTNFAQLNTWILGTLTVVTTLAGFGGLLASFKSKSLKTALETVTTTTEALKIEMEASTARADRLEKERDDYRQKLHDEKNAHDACVKMLHLAELDAVELKAKTDFTPVMQFQQKWYEEQAKINVQMLTVLARVASVLDRIEPKLNVT